MSRTGGAPSVQRLEQFYASLPWEAVEWSAFDFVGVDHYRTAQIRDRFVEMLEPAARSGAAAAINGATCSTMDSMDQPAARGMPSPEQMMACMATLATAFADVREQALAELHFGPGTHLLDAGCGAGELAIAVAPRVQPGGVVVGVDLNADTINSARDAAATAGLDVDFRVGDIRDLPCPDDEFDAVRCERVFQHLERADWPRAAAELIRVARPGGIIQLIDPDHLQSAITATDALLARLLVTDTLTLSPNPESGIHLPGLLRAAGAVDIHVEVRPLVITSLATFRAMRNPEAVLQYLVMRHQVEADRAAAFLADLEARDQEGSFLATSIIYVVSGRKA